MGPGAIFLLPLHSQVEYSGALGSKATIKESLDFTDILYLPWKASDKAITRLLRLKLPRCNSRCQRSGC
jgi:hypothetical protein